jgi:hypothetical protein
VCVCVCEWAREMLDIEASGGKGKLPSAAHKVLGVLDGAVNGD